MKTTIGSDAEFFVSIDGTKERLVSIEGRIGGTKDEPLDIGNGIMLQEDNMSAEFNIPPCSSADEFADYIELGISEVERVTGLKAYEKQIGYFDENSLSTKQAQTFGCDPESDAWTGIYFQAECDTSRNWRTAAGHIHIGNELIASSCESQVELIKVLDLFLGLQSVLDDDKEESVMRRKVYGKAGSMRIKEYGVEYRVLSNYWIFNREKTKNVFNMALFCTNLVLSGKSAYEMLSSEKINPRDLVNAINNSDQVYAKDVLTRLSKYQLTTA